jgi:hypothetical protein
VYDDFGIAVGAEDMPARFEFPDERLEIIDFTVEDYGDTAILVPQRLLPRRHVDDRQPPVPKRNARFGMQTAFVRTPMMLGLVHSRDEVAADFASRSNVEDAY